MKFYRWLMVAALAASFAGVAMADSGGGDPTFQIQRPPIDPTCTPTANLYCVSDLTNFQLTLPAGAFSDTLVYTGSTAVTGLEILFPDSNLTMIAVQSNLFANVTSAPELINGQLFLLFTLTGSGPCQYNGVNNPPQTCPGVINPGDQFIFSSNDGFSSPTTIAFTPEPESFGLMAIGILAIVSRRFLQRNEQ